MVLQKRVLWSGFLYYFSNCKKTYASIAIKKIKNRKQKNMTNCAFKTCTELIDVRQTLLWRREPVQAWHEAWKLVCHRFCMQLSHCATLSNDLCCGSTWLRNQPEAQAQARAPSHKSICLLPFLLPPPNTHTAPRLHSIRNEFETNRLNCQKCCTLFCSCNSWQIQQLDPLSNFPLTTLANCVEIIVNGF